MNASLQMNSCGPASTTICDKPPMAVAVDSACNSLCSLESAVDCLLVRLGPAIGPDNRPSVAAQQASPPRPVTSELVQFARSVTDRAESLAEKLRQAMSRLEI